MHVLPPPQIVEREEDCLALLREMLKQSRVALDTETTGTNRSRDVVDCWSVSFRRTAGEKPIRILLPAHRLFLFQPFFESDVEKVFHRSLFDLSMLRNSGVPNVRGPILDTLIMDALIDENREGLHDLKQCGYDYLGILMSSFEESFRGVPLNQLSLEEKAPYATLDAYVTFLLSEVFEQLLRKEPIGDSGRTLWDLYMRFYPRFAELIYEMSVRGWTINTQYLANLEPLLVRDMAEIDYQFNVFATKWCSSQGISLHDYSWERGAKVIKTKPVYPGGFISLTKREQLIHFFTEVQSLPVLEWTEGGASGKKSPAISEEVLLKYSGEYKNNFASLLLQRRGLEKSLNTYIRGLLSELDTSGQIHAELKIMGARTGRLSCKEPNLYVEVVKSLELLEHPKDSLATAQVVKPNANA